MRPNAQKGTCNYWMKLPPATKVSRRESTTRPSMTTWLPATSYRPGILALIIQVCTQFMWHLLAPNTTYCICHALSCAATRRITIRQEVYFRADKVLREVVVVQSAWPLFFKSMGSILTRFRHSTYIFQAMVLSCVWNS